MWVHPPVSRRAACTGVAAGLLFASAIFAPGATVGQPAEARPLAAAAPEIDRHIAEAAERFGLPPHWIRAVVAVESAGDPRAVSRAGAMGLMQVMPATWAELRAAHGLGDDPFDPRDNVLAGAAYLREMLDWFGSPGFLAAYNAGPTRYAEHLATGRPLPRETRDYLAVLAPMINEDAGVSPPQSFLPDAIDWRDAPLFVSAPVARRADVEDASGSVAGSAPWGLFAPLQTRRAP
ncbi:MAG: lytic transglycosylase domain-containing protein [Pikeienuella sp.]|uniref:lytic transglycosylase domain-containing protein n=1 Tax=Pikeienuella sp. TaxID=2831957 RepID=UPI003919F8A5